MFARLRQLYPFGGRRYLMTHEHMHEPPPNHTN